MLPQSKPAQPSKGSNGSGLGSGLSNGSGAASFRDQGAATPSNASTATVEEKVSILKALYEQRLNNVVGQLRETFLSRVRGDSAMVALLSDGATADFAPARMEEVIESALHGEREATITRLSEALAGKEADFRAFQRIAQTKEAALQDKIALQAASYNTLHSQLDNTMAQLTRERDMAAAAQAQAATAIAAANAGKEAAKNIAEQRLAQVHAAEVSRTTAEAAVAAMHLQLEEVEARLRSFIDRCAALERENAATAADRDRQRARAAECSAREAAAVTRASRLQEENSIVKAAHVAAEQRAVEASAGAGRIPELEEALAAMRKERDLLNSRLSEAVHAAARTQARLDDARNESKRLQGRIDEQQQRVEALEGELSASKALHASSAALQSRVDELSSALEEAVGDARAYAQAAVEAAEENKAVKARMAREHEEQLIALRAEASREASRLREELSRAGDALEDAREQVRLAVKSKSELEITLSAAWEGRRKELSDRLRGLEEDLSRQASQHHQERGQLEAEVRQRGEALQSLREHAGDVERRLQDAEQDLSSAVDKIAGLEGLLSERQSSHEEEAGDLRIEAAELQEGLRQLKEQHEEDRQRWEEEQLARENEAAARHQDELQRLRSTLMAAQAQQAEQHEQERARLAQEHEEAANRLQNQLEAEKSQTERLRQQLEERSSQAYSESAKSQLEEERASLQAKITFLGDELASMEAVRDQLLQQNRTAAAAVEDAERHITSLEGQVEALRNQLQAREEQAEKAKKEAEAALEMASETTAARQDGAQGEQEHQHQQLSDAIRSLEAQLQQADSRRETAESELQEARSSISSLEEQLATAVAASRADQQRLQGQCDRLVSLVARTLAALKEAGVGGADESTVINEPEEQLEALLARGLSALAPASSSNPELEQERDAAAAEATAARRALDAMRSRLHELESLLSSAASQGRGLESLAADYSRAQASLRAAEQENEHLRAQLESTLNDLASKEEELQRATLEQATSTASLSSQMRALQERVKEALEQKAEAVKQANRYQRAASTAQSNLQALLGVLLSTSASGPATVSSSGLGIIGEHEAAVKEAVLAAADATAEALRVASQDLDGRQRQDDASSGGNASEANSTSTADPSMLSAVASVPRVKRTTGKDHLAAATSTPAALSTPSRLLRGPQPSTPVSTASSASLPSSFSFLPSSSSSSSASAPPTPMAAALHRSQSRFNSALNGIKATLERVRVVPANVPSAGSASVADADVDGKIKRALQGLSDVEGDGPNASARHVAEITALVQSLSSSHNEEVGHLQSLLTALRARVAELESELRLTRKDYESKLALLEASSVDRLKGECERVRAEVEASFEKQVAAERERAERAVSKLKGLRTELLSMAHQADAKISQETAARTAAEQAREMLERKLEESRTKRRALQLKCEELAAALKLTTLTLKKAESKGINLVSTTERTEKEAGELRRILDRTMATLGLGSAGSSSSTSSSASSSRRGSIADASVAFGAGDAGAADDASGLGSAGGDPLNDSLASAARLNDLTQRLSAYVHASSSSTTSAPAVAGGDSTGRTALRSRRAKDTSHSGPSFSSPAELLAATASALVEAAAKQ